MAYNYRTIWVCPKCKLDNKTRTESKNINLLQDRDMSPVDNTDVIQSDALCSNNEFFDNYENDTVYAGSFASSTPFNETSSLGVLTEKDFDVVESPAGWLDCTIIHQTQVYLQQLNRSSKTRSRASKKF